MVIIYGVVEILYIVSPQAGKKAFEKLDLKEGGKISWTAFISFALVCAVIVTKIS